MPTRADLVSEARKWVGAPWQHQGRTTTGLDCVGLLVVCAQSLGIEHEDKTGYARDPDGVSFMSHLLRFLTPTYGNAIMPGRVGVFRENLFPCHVAIFGEMYDFPSVIHSSAKRRKCVEEIYQEHHGSFKLVGVYDVVGVT